MKYKIVVIITICMFILCMGCTQPYPTQTITVVDKYQDVTWLNTPQYHIINEDGISLTINGLSGDQELATYTSMQKGHTYLCDVNAQSSRYEITRNIKEVSQ